MTYYIDDYNSTYTIHETTFTNPVNGNPTLLFVLVNESGTVLRASADTWSPKTWVSDFGLRPAVSA